MVLQQMMDAFIDALEDEAEGGNCRARSYLDAIVGAMNDVIRCEYEDVVALGEMKANPSGRVDWHAVIAERANWSGGATNG